MTGVQTCALPIFPEIWRWVDNRLEIYRLVDAVYVQVENSATLSEFPFEHVLKILELRYEVDETSLVRRFRAKISE